MSDRTTRRICFLRIPNAPWTNTRKRSSSSGAIAGSVRGTITLSSQISVTDDLTVRGPGAGELTVSGGAATRVFAVLPADLAGNPYVTPTPAQVATTPEVTLSGLTVAEGLAVNAPGFDPAAPGNVGFAFGGGLYSLGGTVHLDRVRMAHNAAAGGSACDILRLPR